MTMPHGDPQDLAGLADDRPLTCNDAGTVYQTILTAARDRYAELSDRDLSARTAALLRERGEFDGQPGSPAGGSQGPLSAAEHLERIAIGVALARYYRHPSVLDHAVKAGASWEQIGAARGTSTDQARRDYREWVEGQHNLLTWTEGRIGMSDAEYAQAIARFRPRDLPRRDRRSRQHRHSGPRPDPVRPRRPGRAGHALEATPARRARPRPSGTPRRRPGSERGRTRGA
jgi:hypothetical protein